MGACPKKNIGGYVNVFSGGPPQANFFGGVVSWVSEMARRRRIFFWYIRGFQG